MLAIGTWALGSAPVVAFESGDVPAPVDGTDDAGPGNSHENTSGISGFDGNQGNDRNVGNAGGGRPGGGSDDGSTDERSTTEDDGFTDGGESLIQ
jgi:hypothetical protein